MHEISGEAYIVFGIILFFWELLPTSLVVVFFRVQRPNQNLVKAPLKRREIAHHLSSRAVPVDAICFCKPVRLQEG